MPRSGNLQPAIDNAEHIGPSDTGDNIEAKRTANYAWNGSEWGRYITNSVTSTVDVNSANTTTGGNWSANTWTGDGEQNDYQYLAVSLQTDEAGTLFFDFSVDGTNWNTFPTAGFPVLSGVQEIHTAYKASRYFRPRFVGTGGRTYFRLFTYYTNTEVRLNSPLNLPLTSDADAVTVKAPYKMEFDSTPSTVSDGDYDLPSMTRHREVRTRDQRAVDLANCNTVGDYTALGNDTTGLASSNNHVFGTSAITFNKVNGAANTVFAGVSTTFTAKDISELYEDGAFIGVGTYLPSLTNVVAVFCRIGTDASNYNEWEWGTDDIISNSWMALRAATSQPSGYAGTGWNTNSISYVAFGVEFNSESNTLSGIIFDNIHLVKGRVTDTTLDAAISTSVTSPNINVARVGGSQTDTNTGNSSAGTQRVVIATDQPAFDVNAAFSAATYATRIDEASATVTYIGKADPGTSSASALWQVQKIDTTTGTVITFADGNSNFDNVWDNRASLSYS